MSALKTDTLPSLLFVERGEDPSLFHKVKGRGARLFPEREEDLSLFDEVVASRRRGVGEARPIVDPSTMGFFAREQESTLSDFVGERGSSLPKLVSSRLRREEGSWRSSLRARTLDQKESSFPFIHIFDAETEKKRREKEFGKCFLAGGKRDIYPKKRHTL